MKKTKSGDYVWRFRPASKRLELHEIVEVEGGKIIESRPLKINEDVPVYGESGELIPGFVHPVEHQKIQAARAKRLKEIVKKHNEKAAPVG